MTEAKPSTIDANEIDRFSRLAREWWNPAGKFKPLHKFNPVRLDYIREQVCMNFGLDLKDLKPFEGLRILDIGCGGGLICEPMARLGASVVGADASETNIEVAKIHAAQSDLAIDYRATTSEDLERAGETFDVVLALEIVEHVSDVDLFLSSCAKMVKPGGLLFVATINRTLKAGAMAIFGAEYVLRWLPRGTHQYSKLVRPQEIEAPVLAAGLDVIDETGVVYNPLSDSFRRSSDIDVNYMILSRRPREGEMSEAAASKPPRKRRTPARRKAPKAG
ncbi:3-demethylubiquinone-9 3-methyltransferase [Consotaella salsifontis]|uniref:Ubiquinone biosynthesis O-methyltransferase n=1 Tax=Consotaella salsifontis TaxID=1365950 RepID=A0A1T4QLI7_9HYPH|nr:3-demethylubiquinone-9 3-methyltransferase [Consotaella salsifontis]